MIGVAQIRVSAQRSSEGEVTASATGVCSYGDRVATATVDITDEKALAAIGKALEKAVEDVTDDVSRQAQNHAVEAAYVASKKGEEI